MHTQRPIWINSLSDRFTVLDQVEAHAFRGIEHVWDSFCRVSVIFHTDRPPDKQRGDSTNAPSLSDFVLQPPKPESMPEHMPVLRPKQAKP